MVSTWQAAFLFAVVVALATSGKSHHYFLFLKDVLSNLFEGRGWEEITFWTAVTLAFSVLLYQALMFVFAPLKRVMHLEEVGYLNHHKRNSLSLSQDMRKRRDRGNLPPPFPNGWYSLALSSELEPKGVLNVEALGHHFAVFRGEDGEAHILDAYCPHLGANLGCGGKVAGNALQCPFHGWEFRGDDGKCVKIPYSPSPIPASAKTKAWPTMEVNGQILVWFDAEGRDPMWAPPSLPGIENGSWSSRGFTMHTVNAHIQEVPENGADVPHLNFLHSPIILSGNDLRETQTGKGPSMKFIQHTWDASWKPNKGEDGHIAILTLRHGITLFGYDIAPLALELKASQVGPSLVYLCFDGFFGKGAFVQGLLPIGPLEQRIIHEVWGEWRLPTIIAKLFLKGEAMQVERDIMIWNNKRFNHKPLLTKEEGLILQFRRWYSQFYSENSREVATKSVNTMDW